MKDTIIPLAGMMNAVLMGSKQGCDELVLSGGEPTLFPEYIIELLSYAETLGYKKYIIQTNGYGFAKHEKLNSFVEDESKKAEICISFSVHGHTEEIHDDLSSRKGAFLDLIAGMQRISRTQCKIYTNTVVNSKNINKLRDIARLVKSYNPDIMQFSTMHLKEKSELSVSFTDTVKAIKELRKEVNLNVLRTEGVPYCCLHGMEQCVGESAWPTKLDLYNKDNDYMSDFKQIEHGMRKKMDGCKRCILNEICMGVWSEHYDELCNMGIHPIE